MTQLDNARAEVERSYQYRRASVAKALFLHAYPLEDWHAQHQFTVDKFYDQAAVALNALGERP